MAEIEIVEYRSVFREPALQLLDSFFRVEGFAVSAPLLAERFDRFTADDRNAVLLALAGEEVLGVITLTTTFGLEFGLSAELEDLYVAPEARGRGVASHLLDAALAWCRAQGVREAYLVVLPEDLAAGRLVPFYEARGFVEKGRRLLFFDGDLSGSGAGT